MVGPQRVLERGPSDVVVARVRGAVVVVLSVAKASMIIKVVSIVLKSPIAFLLKGHDRIILLDSLISS